MDSCYYRSPVGLLQITADENGINRISVLHTPSDGAPPVMPDTSTCPLLKQACIQLREYFNGTRQYFELPLSLHGTDFQQRVWAALLDIPYGETRSYSEIAHAVDSPKGWRAVGMANHQNPVMIVVPCHRVIGKNGSLTGYAGGLGIKQALLQLEQSRDAP